MFSGLTFAIGPGEAITVTGRSADDHVREAIQDHLDEIEDVELAESRVAALKSGESRTVTLQAVMDRHGLSD
ncbi:MAG: CopG family transcriptional regulator [Methylobacterium sp.]|nr:MAG: CopG family transcriptional regulator [Methylobacterium sp.]